MNTQNLLIIFTRNPELGKCKTRLAATIGDSSALSIYKFLLAHTVSITENLDLIKQVHYSVKIRENDIWDRSIYSKKKQEGDDLGMRMLNAFEQGFNTGFKNIIIIGSDMYDLSQKDIEDAFLLLEQNDFTIGPAEDGGYYLLGMKKLKPELFRNKYWGTNSVLKNTLSDLLNEKAATLAVRNDIDIYDDIKDIELFQQFIETKLYD